MDEFFRTVKNFPDGDPVWPRIIGFGKYMADANGRLANWKDVSKPCALVGGLSSTDIQAAGAGTVRTAYYLDDLPVNDYEAGVYMTGPGTANASVDFGARGSTNGITISGRNSTANTMAARCGGAIATTIGATTDWNGIGLHSVCRKNATEFEAYKGSVKKATITNAAATLERQLIVAFGQNQNGNFVASTNVHSAWFISRALTDAQRVVLDAAIERLHQKMAYGDLDDYLPGVQPASVSAYNYVIWGASAFGFVAAYELSRQGKSVAIVGDAFDRRLGGMSSGGLGFADIDAITSIQGLSRWVLRQCQVIEGKGTSVTTFQPQTFERVMRTMCDPARANGRNIPVFWSDGVKTASEDATGITINTEDGRSFRCKYAMECTDENTLIRALGISTFAGREAAGSGNDSYNGRRLLVNNFKNNAGTTIQVDPFITPGTPASGLLPGVHGLASAITTPEGGADDGVQAFNERVTLTNDPSIRVPFPATPPAGYSALNYEMIGRQFAIDPTITLAKLLKYDAIMSTTHGFIFDCNNNEIAGQSTDFLGDASKNYVVGSRAAKLAIRNQIKNYILGLFYWLQYEPDARIPATVRTLALTFGLVANHYCDPDWASGQKPNWMHRTYVREPARLVTDYQIIGADMNAGDGTTPRSTKTVGVAVYSLDSHWLYRYAFDNAGTWEVRGEGNFIVSAGGVDKTTPIPYEACIPMRTQSKRVAVAFGISANHVAFGSTRMEFSAMQAAQSLACALMIADEQGIDVQDVDYATLRTRILATATLANETAPYLPQMN
ncbi:hypothetical protein AX761_20925 [Rhizobium sp. 58]|nr:hypothetical protein AX761_20925 [Rhizobium sp. 58]